MRYDGVKTRVTWLRFRSNKQVYKLLLTQTKNIRYAEKLRKYSFFPPENKRFKKHPIKASVTW